MTVSSNPSFAHIRDMRTVDDLFIKDGYVLDFSNPTYATFFREEIGVDIDHEKWSAEGGSKGKRLAAAQERKHEAIQLAGAFRDATLISLASFKDTPFPTDDEFKAEWTKWVKWILVQGDQPFL